MGCIKCGKANSKTESEFLRRTDSGALTEIDSALAADPPVATTKSSPEDRLLFMRSTGESYTLTVGEKGVAKFQK